MRRTLSTLAILVALCVVAQAATVTLSLQSTKNGQTVQPGTPIDWTIRVAVSTGDNQGLALIACDLVQDAANPAKFDIPPGDVASIDTTMDDFSRPLGISNPGEGSATTGYIGVQRGTAGQKNLIQIGGAQNTFGAAGPTGIGQDFTVNGGIGQGAQPQHVLSGSFLAPSTPGTYTFRLTNGLANVLTSIGTPPAYSPVAQATVNTAGAQISFTVATGPTPCAGDMDCSGLVDFDDIDRFVEALSYPGGAGWPYPNCPWLNGDCNNDGSVNFDDIDAFVARIGATCP